MNYQLQVTISVKLFEPILNKYYLPKGKLLEEVKDWYLKLLNENLDFDDTIKIKIINLEIKDNNFYLVLDLQFKNKEDDPEEIDFMFGYILKMIVDEIDDDGNYPFETDGNEYLIDLTTEKFEIINFNK